MSLNSISQSIDLNGINNDKEKDFGSHKMPDLLKIKLKK